MWLASWEIGRHRIRGYSYAAAQMDDVTVYFLTQRLTDLPSEESWLAPGERARAARLRFPKRRNDWILGRWTAKRAIRSFLALTARVAPGYPEIEISSAPDGAPEVIVGDSPARVAISLSHSGEQGLCAVAASPLSLGCDVESVQQRDLAFVEDCFRAEERSMLALFPVERQPLMATLIWSAKESALKCLREGLRRDTRSVTVNVNPEQGQGWNSLTVRCLESTKLYYGWWRTANDSVQTIAADARFKEPVELTV